MPLTGQVRSGSICAQWACRGGVVEGFAIARAFSRGFRVPPRARSGLHSFSFKMAPKKTVEKKGGKKKLSGYMAFAQERRPTLKEEQPDLTFGEVGARPPSARPPAPSRPHPANHFRLIDSRC